MIENTKKNRDIFTKVICLFIAILIWSYVMNRVDPVISRSFYSVPVEFRNTTDLESSGRVLASPESATVDIVVRGTRQNLSVLNENNISAYIDTANLKEGTQMKVVNVRVGHSGVSVEEILPEQINMVVDTIVERNFPIEFSINGNLPKGYMVDEKSVQGEEVKLKGAKSSIDKVAKVISTIDVSGKKESFIERYPLIAIDREGNRVENITIEPREKEVQVKISRTLTVPIEISYVGVTPNNFDATRVEIDPNTVTLIGEDNLLGSIENIKTENISRTDLMENSPISVNLQIPDGIRLVNSNEQYILRYNPLLIGKRTMEIPTTIVYRADGTIMEENIKRKPATIKVTLTGEDNLLSALKVEDIRIVLVGDVVDDEIGIKVEVPKNIEVESTSIEKLRVE